MTKPTTRIRLRQGADAVTPIPEEARTAGLSHRTAIIQETYRPDRVDMFFDEALFLRLLDYARNVSNGGEITIIAEVCEARPSSLLAKLFGEKEKAEDPRSLDAYLQGWQATAPDEREPPLRIIVLQGGAPTLCIATEYWTRVGGPPEYHDSYTYSVFSREDRSQEIADFLGSSPEADSWSIAADA